MRKVVPYLVALFFWLSACASPDAQSASTDVQADAVPLAECRPHDYSESWTMQLDLENDQTLMAMVNVMYESVEGLHIRVYPYNSLSAAGLPIHEKGYTDLEIVWRCEEDKRNHIVAMFESRFGEMRTVSGSPFPPPNSPPPTWTWEADFGKNTVTYQCKLLSSEKLVAEEYPAAEVECQAISPLRDRLPQKMRWLISSHVRFAGFQIDFADGSMIRTTLRWFSSAFAPKRLLPR
ncbi:MAG: hypothetical protein QXS54_00835 [Candidatus Methanomethylicaceae archaeon]